MAADHAGGDWFTRLNHYRDLVHRKPLFAEGACWTVPRRGTDFRSLLGRLSLGPVGRGEPVPFDGLYSDDVDVEGRAFGWLVETSSGAALVEASSIAGSTEETLAHLSHGGAQVASFSWIAATASHVLCFARDGRVWSTAELDGDPLDDLDGAPPDALRVVRQLVAHVERFGPVVVGLAAVDMWSGQRLDDDILDCSWPVLSFAPITKVQVPTPDTMLGRLDPKLALALDAASSQRLLAAQTHAIKAMLIAKGLSENAACRRVATSLAAGLPTDPWDPDLTTLTGELKGRYKIGRKIKPIGAWQRWQAVHALWRFAAQSNDYRHLYRHEGWNSVRLAMNGDQDNDQEWQTLRTQLLTMLTGNDHPADPAGARSPESPTTD